MPPINILLRGRNIIHPSALKIYLTKPEGHLPGILKKIRVSGRHKPEIVSKTISSDTKKMQASVGARVCHPL